MDKKNLSTQSRNIYIYIERERERVEANSDYGAFMDKLILQPTSSSQEVPLNALTFAVKDIFDIDGYVTGFGSPDWARTHSAATSMAPAVIDVLRGGATCVGKTVMDEMAYSIDGENKHYGTPANPCAPDRVPGGSSSGSAVAVGAKLLDFSLGKFLLVENFSSFRCTCSSLKQKLPSSAGTDTGGSVRVPSSYCGIFRFRPSHGVVSTIGVIPMAQSFDSLPDEDPVGPSHIIIAEDCFNLLSIPSDRITKVLVNSVNKIFGDNIVSYANLGGFDDADNIVSYANLGDYVENKVPSLKHFMRKDTGNQEYNIEILMALSNAMRMLQRHEFKNNHGEWVRTVKPDLGPGISERVWKAVNSTDDNIDDCRSVKTELRAALNALLGDSNILAIPTVPGPPPKLQAEAASLETFQVGAFSLLSLAGVSGFCQVSIPLGMYDNLPVAVSLLARHDSDGFLLNVVETLYGTIKEQVEIAEKLSYWIWFHGNSYIMLSSISYFMI